MQVREALLFSEKKVEIQKEMKVVLIKEKLEREKEAAQREGKEEKLP